MEAEEMKALLRRVRDNIRVTKVVATRSIKGARGDSFAGFSAKWNTVQEDGGQDLVHVGDEDGAPGMTLKEARLAHYMVSLQADIAAYEAALAGGNLPVKVCLDAIQAVKANYGKLIQKALGQDSDG